MPMYSHFANADKEKANRQNLRYQVD